VSPTVETFHRFERLVRDREDISIGEDAREYVRRLGEEAVEARREERIRDEIIRSDGRLEGVDATLYPYQTEGVAFLASKGRALLADDMGLGKPYRRSRPRRGSFTTRACATRWSSVRRH